MYEIQLKSLHLHGRWKLGATHRAVNKSMPKRKVLRRKKNNSQEKSFKSSLKCREQKPPAQPSCPQQTAQQQLISRWGVCISENSLQLLYIIYKL